MSLRVICGSMFSGKSEELVRRVVRCSIGGKGFIIFKHTIDTRYHESDVVSHNGNSKRAYPVTTPQQLLEIWELNKQDVTEIFFDEVQFLEDKKFVNIFKQFMSMGINVTVAGLDTTYEGMPFPGIMGDLLCLADDITKLKAVCIDCGEDACRTKLLVERGDGNGCVKIGGSESYKAVCKSHFNV
jgi:thymidine kinase